MNGIILLIGAILFIIVALIIINLFRMPFNDFLEKTVNKTLWLWLPIHAFKRLSKEFKEKYIK